ncbi:MAG: Ig-like domain-containing protein, partial [Gemmatimonadaceae bacterium]
MKNWWLVCLALAAACGGDGSSTPTVPTVPNVTSITVTGSDLLFVGTSETFTAAGNTGALNAPRWGSDAPTVATVDILTGQVTAVGTGAATIFVDATPGIRGTKLIRTLP